MKTVSIYGNHAAQLAKVSGRLEKYILEGGTIIQEKTGMNPVEHLKARIKSEKSIREKCRRLGIPETTESIMENLHDVIGLRVVCPFLDDVYLIRDFLSKKHDIDILEEKDYIRHVKENGYRSLHLIVRLDSYPAEIQIRTISMDTWAALEHHIRYKKVIQGNRLLIFDELKRCADELASTDVTLQTIRHMVNGEI
ncbi:MAG: GTP pyrophosphokinase family protein [Lachnospiraceae bacterium]|nr:GTP pyrophosphokinase family protein [Lachnospiraceae bacterium]